MVDQSWRRRCDIFGEAGRRECRRALALLARGFRRIGVDDYDIFVINAALEDRAPAVLREREAVNLVGVEVCDLSRRPNGRGLKPKVRHVAARVNVDEAAPYPQTKRISPLEMARSR